MLDAVAEGNVDPADIRLAARHLLKPTIELGLLDGPTGPFRNLGPDDIDTPEFRQLAFEAGTEAITLLKNDKPAGASAPLLPLSKSGTVAVIGPAANFTQELLANYHGWNTVRDVLLLPLPSFCWMTLLTHTVSWWAQVVDGHSPWMALQQRLGSRLVASELGCERHVGATAGVLSCDVMDNGTAAVSAAVAAAEKAEVVLMFAGTNPIGNVVACQPADATCRLTTEAEGVDRVSIRLPGVQSVLTQAVLRANPNTVLVLLNAGPLAIEWEAAHVPAIVEAYFPGEFGGDAVAAVLMGDVSPSGRLPVTVYPAEYIQRNMTDYDLASGNGTTHLYYKGTPLWNFGFGLHYTTFAFGLQYTDDELGPASDSDPDAVPADFSTAGVVDGSETIAYSVVVTNTGGSSSAVSVVALLSSEHPDSTTNEKLVDFAKTPILQPGESTVVSLEVTKVRRLATLPLVSADATDTKRRRLLQTHVETWLTRFAQERLALIDELGDERIAPGAYQLRLGGSGSGSTRDNDFVRTSFVLRGEEIYMWRLSEARGRWQASLAQ